MKSVSVLGLIWLVVGCGVSYLGDGAETDGGVAGQGGSGGTLGSGGSAGAWSPCAGLACGTICNMAACPPNEACALLYAEGRCDRNGACTQQDPQCPVENPCAGKACGDTCTPPCPAGQSCPAVLGYCSEAGACALAYPVCNGTCRVDGDCPVQSPACEQCPDGSTVCTVASCVDGQCAYAVPGCPASPCAGKACGDTCTPPCPSGQACPTVMGYCDDNGACNLAYPVCDTVACNSGTDCPPPPPYCEQCPGGSSVCPAATCVNGQCAIVTPGCPDYSPCAGKACGDACSPFVGTPPTKPMYCNADLGCQTGAPACGPGYGSCNTLADCDQFPAICRLCANAAQTCAEPACLGGSCLLACPL